MQNQMKETNAQTASLNGGKQDVDLSSPGVAKQVARQVLQDVDHYCATAYDDGHRNHLGASLIGRECKRFLWYVFRWCHKEQFDGRMQRLFNRGHREEARFIEWLEGIGAKVWYEDRSKPPNEKGEYPQYRISGALGHFGGSLDAVIVLPERYGIPEPILGEFKTNGTGSGFDKLEKDGMAVAKAEHFAQTSVYGSKGVDSTKFRYVLYMNINKNDDSIHVELVKLNHQLGEQMELKAEQIIFSPVPPPRLSDNITFRTCAYCAMKEICHKGAVVERNCRSCANAKPVENAQWFCTVHNDVIPKHIIPLACTSYKSITDNV